MEKTIKKRFLNNSIIVLAGTTLLNFKSLIFLPLIVKTAGIKVYGEYTLLMLMFFLCQGFLSFGTDFSFKRFYTDGKK